MDDEVRVLAGVVDLPALPDGTVKVLTPYRLLGDTAGYLAEIADMIEGPIPPMRPNSSGLSWSV